LKTAAKPYPATGQGKHVANRRMQVYAVIQIDSSFTMQVILWQFDKGPSQYTVSEFTVT